MNQETETIAVDKTETTKLEQAREISRDKAYWAAGVGLIPIPVVDVAGITIIQLKMIHEIAGVYDTTLNENLAKSILAALLVGVGTTAAASGALGSIMKSVPLVGSFLGMATLPAAAGSATYAAGMVFAAAFEKKETALADGNVLTTREALDFAIRNHAKTA